MDSHALWCTLSTALPLSQQLQAVTLHSDVIGGIPLDRHMCYIASFLFQGVLSQKHGICKGRCHSQLSCATLCTTTTPIVCSLIVQKVPAC